MLTPLLAYGGKKTNQQILNELLALKHRDTYTRSLLLQEGSLYGGYATEMQQVHRENAVQLDRIIEEHGWPGISLVGLEGCQAAWLIAQHSICTPDLQRRFLTFLVEASESGEAPRVQVAFLTDRIRFNEDQPQVYGTVLDWNENGELWCEVEDIANLDGRRNEVGLAPFRESLEERRREVDDEGGQPPADFAQYRQARHEWARSVGWV